MLYKGFLAIYKEFGAGFLSALKPTIGDIYSFMIKIISLIAESYSAYVSIISGTRGKLPAIELNI